MSKKVRHNNVPAFPSGNNDGVGVQSSRVDSPEGITTRDYFAAKVIEGLIVNTIYTLTENRIKEFVQLSYNIADEMIKFRDN